MQLFPNSDSKPSRVLRAHRRTTGLSGVGCSRVLDRDALGSRRTALPSCPRRATFLRSPSRLLERLCWGWRQQLLMNTAQGEEVCPNGVRKDIIRESEARTHSSSPVCSTASPTEASLMENPQSSPIFKASPHSTNFKPNSPCSFSTFLFCLLIVLFSRDHLAAGIAPSCTTLPAGAGTAVEAVGSNAAPAPRAALQLSGSSCFKENT